MHAIKGTTANAQDAASDSGGRFSNTEAEIRTTYDAFLDYLERFQSFVESGLISPEDLKPYLNYWVADVVSLRGPQEDLAWTLSFLA